MFDHYYDELDVGDRRIFRGVTITEAHIVGFAGVTGDHYPLHMDAEFAAKSRFGQRIAHGFLVLSSSAGMFPMEPGVVVAFYGMDSVRFLAPTFIGDTLHAEMEVIEKRDKGEGGVVSVRLEMHNQRNEIACVATMHVLCARRAMQ
jgi:3-hydroxybutyryl-CoA dehydratase